MSRQRERQERVFLAMRRKCKRRYREDQLSGWGRDAAFNREVAEAARFESVSPPAREEPR